MGDAMNRVWLSVTAVLILLLIGAIGAWAQMDVQASSIDPGFTACAPPWPGDRGFARPVPPWPGDPGFFVALSEATPGLSKAARC